VRLERPAFNVEMTRSSLLLDLSLVVVKRKVLHLPRSTNCRLRVKVLNNLLYLDEVS
jgi:hypothetical protein